MRASAPTSPEPVEYPARSKAVARLEKGPANLVGFLHLLPTCVDSLGQVA